MIDVLGILHRLFSPARGDVVAHAESASRPHTDLTSHRTRFRLAIVRVLLAGAPVFAPPAFASLTFYTDPAEFEAVAGNLTREDFEEGNVIGLNSTNCSDPFDSQSSDACWEPGDIAPRLSLSSSSGSGLYILGELSLGFPTKTAGAQQEADATRVTLRGGTLSAGLVVYVPSAAGVTASVYGPGDVLLGDTTIAATPAGQFFGVVSTSAIVRVELGAVANGNEFIDDVRYGPVLDADLKITQDVVEDPPGTLTHTLVVTNQGQSAASGVVVTDMLPAQLAYVSNDCGAANGASWMWTIGTLGAGASAQCKLTTSIVSTGTIFTNVAEVAGAAAEPSPGDNRATAWLAPGLSTYFSDPVLFEQAAGATAYEDFEEGNVAPGLEQQCSNIFSATTDDQCWDKNDIVPHLAINTNVPGGTYIVGADFLGNTSIVVGARNLGGVPNFVLRFPDQDAQTVGLDVLASGAGGRVDVSVFGADDLLLGKTVVTASPPGRFVGFATAQPIDHVTVAPLNDLDVYIDNVRFGPPIDTDLQISVSGDENPGGTMLITVAVYNLGALDATGVIASLTIPPALAYVSDDCAGSNAPSWAWNVGAIAHGEKAVCHIVTSVVVAQGFLAKAKIETADQADPIASNDTYFWIDSAAGAGPGTPENGFALFRSFADLPFKDQTGAPFSLRDHADQVILLQVCAEWCEPCRSWTGIADDLKAAVDQQIGAGHFLDVDMIVQNTAANASTQTTATNWKNTLGFPGVVLHAEGSKLSPLYKMLDDLTYQYADVPAQFFFPTFFVLAPGCQNQIAVRGTSGAVQVGEERQIDTSTIDDMAALITDVWWQRPCAQPLLHRIDRCGVGSAPILSVPLDGTSIESAEAFTVPGGGPFDIGYVTAVTDAALVDVSVYADGGGSPGALVCDTQARPASKLFAPMVRKFRLEPHCELGPGDYWLSLKAREASPSEPLTWLGGILPRDVSYVVRDALDTLGSGCTDWGPASNCVSGAQAATELCFMLEPDDTVFHSGFEAALP